ncbi:MAG: YraN family protein [Coriobacteriales bacterium]|jgi:putative endonuclease|nr:YraN family protein [Coriobacteriales bacterium]
MTERRQRLGKQGEDIACAHLQREGINIIERNWRCAAGEVDIIAREGDDIVFIEVKTRSNLDRGLPEDAVTATKRNRYERIAMYYLSEKSPPTSRLRFDVIAILSANGQQALLRHHRDAFGFGG